MSYVDFVLSVLHTFGYPLSPEELRTINVLFDAGASVYKTVQSLSESNA